VAGSVDKKTEMPRKLSYAAISDITGIDKETVRRSVKRLAEQEWVVIDQKTGIHYKPSVSNQDKLLMLNEWELTHLGRLIERLNDN
jgi:DNA-binding FadR family transcriptional regulator